MGLACGPRCKATSPAAPVCGCGPRLPGCVGERAGLVGARRSAVPDLCAAVRWVLLSQGASQKMVERVSQALLPHSNTIGAVARPAPVN
jgi:hypothetical protein